MQQKAIKLLNSDQKVFLMDEGTKKNKRQFLILLLIFVLYFSLIFLNIIPFILISILFFASILIVSGIGTYTQYQLYKSKEFPEDYLKMYLVANLITSTGIIIYAVMRLLNTENFI